MKVFFRGTGDESVGIHATTGTLEIDGYTTEEFIKSFSDEEREFFREDFKRFLEGRLDESPVSIHFDDECPDCGKVECDRKCMCPDEHEDDLGLIQEDGSRG
jgi:hypothetical protein